MDEKTDTMILDVFYILSYYFFAHTKLMEIISFCACFFKKRFEQQEALLGYTVLRFVFICCLDYASME